MRIQTYSIVVGSKACNAQCPFCVSKMTPNQGIGAIPSTINWRNFAIGCRFAKNSGVSTVLLTGKGEPTIFPEQISDYLERLGPYEFPFIELQTNGILMAQEGSTFEQHLPRWYELGLTIIALSVVGYDNGQNQAIFRPDGQYPDLAETISYLHHFGFSIRLSCTMFRGGIDSPQEVDKLIDFARSHQVEQLSIRPVRMPHDTDNREVAFWVKEHQLNDEQLSSVSSSVKSGGIEILRLAHGAVVYDVDGQNICLTDCLTLDPNAEEVRQLIFFPDGHLRHDWQYPGAILV